MNGSYHTFVYSYETGNGIKADETGTLKKVITPEGNNGVIIAAGSFSYTSPEGQLISITYTGDDVNGFVAQVSNAAKTSSKRQAFYEAYSHF